MTGCVAQVALPLPLFEPYTYSIPESIADRVVPGARVVVPVRRRELVGIVVGAREADSGKGETAVTPSVAVTLSLSAAKAKPPKLVLRDILAAPDAAPALTPPMLRTAEWMAGYYGAPIGIALKAMLPAPMWGSRGWC
jgi:primosomal protein N' (replication factor Y)